MDKKIENVDMIVIDYDEIWIFHAGRQDVFRRGDWLLYAEDIQQMQDERVMVRKPYMRTLFSMKPSVGVGCQVLEDEKMIFCGEHPEKMLKDWGD